MVTIKHDEISAFRKANPHMRLDNRLIDITFEFDQSGEPYGHKATVSGWLTAEQIDMDSLALKALRVMAQKRFQSRMRNHNLKHEGTAVILPFRGRA